jgi:hypothetical protein
VIKYNFASGTIANSKTNPAGNHNVGIVEIEGLNWIVLVSEDTKLVAYDSDLTEMWTRDLNMILNDVYDFAWRQGTIYGTFASALNSRKPNYVAFKDFCHPACDDNCETFPVGNEQNCTACDTAAGMLFIPETNRCEIQCTAGSYPNSDYTACIPCPTCCSDCAFATTPTFPYEPVATDLICSPLHEDYILTAAGVCTLKQYDYTIV